MEIFFRYNKIENLSSDAFERFDYILLGSNTDNLREIISKNFSTTHKEHFVVEAFHKIFFKSRNSFPFYLPIIRFKEKVIVLKKISNG